MKIIRSIVGGERDAKVLAQYRHQNCKSSLEIIRKSLEGNYKNEHVFTLKQALELYDIYQDKIIACDAAIEQQLLKFTSKMQRVPLAKLRKF
jgi:hypothetical protein